MGQWDLAVVGRLACDVARRLGLECRRNEL